MIECSLGLLSIFHFHPRSKLHTSLKNGNERNSKKTNQKKSATLPCRCVANNFCGSAATDREKRT